MSRISAVRAAHSPDPETTWSALAPALAARGRMRVSRDGGRTYSRKGERRVDERLPNQPAAVLAYDHNGCAPTIFLDLDVSRGDVDRDHARLARLLDRVGARWFSDTSPSGGRHIYIPLAVPAPLAEARAFVASLAASTPTLDSMPMASIESGCLRPPGSRHRSGGHQSLDQSLAAAVDALQVPTPDSTWKRLIAEVGAPVERPARLDVARLEQDGNVADDQEERLDALSGFTEPDATYARIARTGDWDTAHHRTASEARQAVVWSAVASGWAIVDVARRLADGTWPGLASMYARYPSRHRHAALVRDWRNAITFESQRRNRANNTSGTRTVRVRTTSPLKTHAGAPKRAGGRANREVRVWLAAVDFLTRDADPSVRAVLYALGQAAALTDDLVVEHGNRSLAIATGLDQSTVGRALKALREAPKDRMLIDLVREAESVRANTYALVIPDLLRPACEKKPWRRGKIHAIRPAFRALGLVAAFVYGALEQRDDPRGGRDIAADAGVGHSAAYEALATLHAWGLAEKVTGGWVIGKASLNRLAEQFGTADEMAEQIHRYRQERLAWWRYLGIVDQAPPDETADPGFDPALDDPWAVPAPPSSLTAHSPGTPLPHSEVPAQDVVVRLAEWRAAMDGERAEADAAAEAAALDLLGRVLGARALVEGSG